MEKKNKIYEAPEAEMIKMQMPSVLMDSGDFGGNSGTNFSW